MKKLLKTLTMAMICIAMTIFVSCKKNNAEPSGDGTHEYVDLGLPSGTLWATCNVGANSPEEYGDYFAWGETSPKINYDWSTYKWCNGSYDTFTKYNTDSCLGTVDNKTTLEPADDAAHVNWGGNWRMPTRDEFVELKDNCTWQWTTQGGNDGYLFIGTNGNSIFMPAAGYCDKNILKDCGSSGYYWSNSLFSFYPYGAYQIDFRFDIVGMGYINRREGLSVRPVCTPQN